MFNEDQLEDMTLKIFENLGYERLCGYDIIRDYHSVFMDFSLFLDLKAINEEKEDRTIVLVSHRQSTMRIVDNVYCVEHGRIS